MRARTDWPELRVSEIHIWTVPLTACLADIDELRALLSPDEQERAGQFHFPHLEQRFAITHGILRILLAHYLGTPADTIGFTASENGKPAVTAPQTRLQFNLSHSRQMVAFAFGLDYELGVDIEEIRLVPEMEGIAHQFFSQGEIEDLMSVPVTDRPAAFFHIWTRKEAYIKATGKGLRLPLASFRVSVLERNEARVLDVGGNPNAVHLWHMYPFEPASSHVGALAYRGAQKTIQIFPLSDSQKLLCGV
jgi:4'-phosphopantetheinyl transferase